MPTRMKSVRGPSYPGRSLKRFILYNSTPILLAALIGIAPVAAARSETEGDEGQAEGAEPVVPVPEVERRAIPDGFVEMQVLTVAPTEGGNVVLLTDRLETVLVPIWIGETEALSIALRMEGQGFRRPLTHDLIDALLRELGAQIVEVRIDSLQADTFVASVFVHDGDREFLLDSRASDAIALALGSHVPIFVSTRVIGETGIRPSELGLPPAAPGEQSPSEEGPEQHTTPL